MAIMHPKPRITELTPQQWLDVAAARDATLNRCLVDPIDWDQFRQAAADCYAAMGDPAPLVVVAPGPTAALAWAALLATPGMQRLALTLDDGAALAATLAAAPTPAKEQLQAQLRSVHWPWWRHAWLSHWLHVATIEGIDPPPDDIMAKARAYQTFTIPPMTIPLDGVVIACDQWTELHRTADGLHCTTGPAWAWPDGTEVWALEGIRVPEWAVLDPDPARVLANINNAEQRRVIFSHIGWGNVVDLLHLEAADSHPDPHMGTLYRLPEDLLEQACTLLVCRNASPDRDGTWRTYGLLAAPGCETVVEAQASLAQLSVEEWLALDGAS